MKSSVLVMLLAAVSATSSVKCYTNQEGQVLCHHDGSGMTHDNKEEVILRGHGNNDNKADVNLRGHGNNDNKEEINLRGHGNNDNKVEINLRGHGNNYLKSDDILNLADDSTVSATMKLDTYTITLISIFVAQIFFCFGICCWTKAQVSNAKKETVKQQADFY